MENDKKAMSGNVAALAAQKQIFVLQGQRNCGKTHTIKEIYEVLKNKYPQSPQKPYNQIPNRKDITLEMDIKPKPQKKVGIESHGDTEGGLSSLNIFAKNGCDIIFCAARTKGKTVDFINSFSKKHNYKVVFILQTEENNPQLQTKRDHKVALDIIQRANL